MRILITLLVVSLIGIQSYAQKQNRKQLYISKDKTIAKPNADGSYGTTFIIPQSFETKTQIEEALAKEDKHNTIIKGTCLSVCQKQGCWLNVKTDDGLEYFVKFKNYGFFVPRDISGKTVVLNGFAYYETMSVEELKRYAEDAGKTQEEIDAIKEPIKRLRFEASGAFVLK